MTTDPRKSDAPPFPAAPPTSLRLGRAAIISIALAVFFGLVSPRIDFLLALTPLGSQHTAPGAFGALLLLVLVVNPILSRFNNRWRLSSNEMLVVYLSCIFSALVAGIGGHNYWPSDIVGAFYYANPENNWMAVLRALPSWMTPAMDSSGYYREELVRNFYVGIGKDGAIPWAAWLTPIGAWLSVIFSTTIMTGCLSVILRLQWSEREALAFPLLRFPVEMVEGSDDAKNGIGPFFRNRLMWIGFGLAAFVQLVNGLSLYFPDIPTISTGISAGPFVSEAPWNQIGYMIIQIFPLAVGLSYILTSEVAFSMWFFFWLYKFQYIAAYYMGFAPATLPSVMPLNTKVFTGYQEVGAYLAFAAMLLWAARDHIRHIVRRSFGLERATAREREEGLPYPLAFWGLTLSFGFLIGWGVLSGAHPLVALTYWGSYLVISLVLARVLADSGLLFVSKIHAPLTVFAQLFGSGPGSMLGGQHAASNSFLNATSDMRSSLMPSWVTALKLISDRKLPARKLFLLFLAVTFISVSLAAITHILISYQYGALSMAAPYTARSAPQGLAADAALFAKGQPTQGPSILFWTGVGIVSVVAMVLMRARFPWFPLHPTGYVMGLSWAMHNLWLSVFIGWACKSLITRFGGNESYRKAIPLFLGLALGDIAMILFWLLVDGLTGRTGHILVP
jgi:hypothetical protein